MCAGDTVFMPAQMSGRPTPGSNVIYLCKSCEGRLISLWVDVWFPSAGDSRVFLILPLFSPYLTACKLRTRCAGPIVIVRDGDMKKTCIVWWSTVLKLNLFDGLHKTTIPLSIKLLLKEINPDPSMIFTYMINVWLHEPTRE